MLLKFFSKEKLWKELMRRELFDDSGEVEATMIWRSVFNRTPELSDFLKRRQIALLKSNALGEKPSSFILGQISENMLWQRFDVPQTKKVETETKKVQVLKPIHEVLAEYRKKK